jgi:hypothetical protein
MERQYSFVLLWTNLKFHRLVRKVPSLNKRNEGHIHTQFKYYRINVCVFQEALFYLEAFQPKCIRFIFAPIHKAMYIHIALSLDLTILTALAKGHTLLEFSCCNFGI